MHILLRVVEDVAAKGIHGNFSNSEMGKLRRFGNSLTGWTVASPKLRAAVDITG
jgi:hypothetical protein